MGLGLAVSTPPAAASGPGVCGDCEEEFYQWPLKQHTSPSSSTGDDSCSRYTCHSGDKAGSCLAYHPSGCGLASIPDLESIEDDPESLDAVLAVDGVKVATAPDGGRILLDCAGVNALVYIAPRGFPEHDRVSE